jgi:hypothetical protein
MDSDLRYAEFLTSAFHSFAHAARLDRPTGQAGEQKGAAAGRLVRCKDKLQCALT